MNYRELKDWKTMKRKRLKAHGGKNLKDAVTEREAFAAECW